MAIADGTGDGIEPVELPMELPPGAEKVASEVRWILDTGRGVLIGIIEQSVTRLLMPPRVVDTLTVPPLHEWRSTVTRFVDREYPDALVEDNWSKCRMRDAGIHWRSEVLAKRDCRGWSGQER